MLVAKFMELFVRKQKHKGANCNVNQAFGIYVGGRLIKWHV